MAHDSATAASTLRLGAHQPRSWAQRRLTGTGESKPTSGCRTERVSRRAKSSALMGKDLAVMHTIQGSHSFHNVNTGIFHGAVIGTQLINYSELLFVTLRASRNGYGSSLGELPFALDPDSQTYPHLLP